MSSDEEALLDAIAEAATALPEPLAAAAVAIEVARAEGDGTGVRKRCFELGIAVVRYGAAVALALMSDALGERRAPKPVAKALGTAARLTDGEWCALVRTLAQQLEALDVDAGAFGFAASKALAELVASRNLFVHEGGRGEDAAGRALALLEEAQALTALPLRVVVALEPPSVQERRGVPIRPGAWRRRGESVPEGASPGAAYLARGERWIAMAPWLPDIDKRLWLGDCPHTAGKPWRAVDPESAERREFPELDAAIRRMVGGNAGLPVVPSERPSLVGRRDVIGTMRRIADLAREGGVYLLVLSGPQGVGRGRMLEIMGEGAAEFGFGTVVEASCSPTRRGVLRPLRRALGQVPELDDVKRAVDEACSGDALGGSAAHDAAVEAVEEALAEASDRHPLLLLVDDLQWADDTTLEVLTLLAERATRKARGHMLVMLGVRDEPASTAQLTRFLGEVERDVGPGATRLTLAPLIDDEPRLLVRGVAPLAPDVEAALVDGAGGLPFYLVQSALAWYETGALVWRDGMWRATRTEVLTEPIPGLNAVVQARLGSLFEPAGDGERAAQQLLLAIALAGSWIALEQLLAAVEAAGAARPLAERALEHLAAAGIVTQLPERHEYGYAQPMVRMAVADELRKKPWAPRLHRALLDVLARHDKADEDAGFLADGYAALGADDEARRWLERAVAYGLRMGLFRDAAARAARLASSSRDPLEKARARLAESDALLRSGDARAAQAVLTAIDDPGDAELALRLRILRLSTASALGDSADDDGLLEAADAVGGVLAVEARLALAKRERKTRGLELVAEAAGMVAATDPSDLGYRVAVLRAELLAETSSIGDAACRAAIEEAHALARALGSTWALLDAENDLALLDVAAGRYDAAIAALKRVASEARKHHFGSVQRGALVNTATVHLRAGRPDAAAGTAKNAAALARDAGDLRNVSIAQSVAADALRQLGKLDEARSAIDEAIALGQRLGETNLALRFMRRAEVRAEAGDASGALADSERATSEAERTGNPSLHARARLKLALLRAALGHEGAGDELARVADELRVSPLAAAPPLKALLAEAEAALSRRR
jgi:tetratricopeptide (TPR) repeat protein